MAKRNWFTYEFKVGNKVVHKGITKDIERREDEHQSNINSKGHIKQVGQPKTEKGAREWEKKEGCS